jgi:uncharacterized protein (TIGR03000 family)
MYSVVLMMAMTGTPDMASFGGRGCRGGDACWGCTGGGCRGGWACNGGGCRGGWACNGGGGHGCRGGLFGGRKHGCHGGGCWGGNNCWGGGGCWGAGSGCWGGGQMAGCCGGMATACWGGSGGCWGGQMMAAPVAQPAKPEAMPKPQGAMVPATATIVVNLPADAKLLFDGRVTSSTEAVRRFVTPELETGVDHSYTLTAQVVRNGQTLTATQVVTVRAGQTSEVRLNDGNFATTLARR